MSERPRWRSGAGWPCPYCAARMYAVDSRPSRDAHRAFTIRRRRVCIACGYRITTHENPAVAPPDPRDTSRWPS